MVGFFTHLMIGLIISIPFMIKYKEHRRLFLLVGLVAATVPDVDVILGGFDTVDVSSSSFFLGFDDIAEEMIHFSITEQLDEGIIDKELIKIEHRGITHSSKLCFGASLILLLITAVLWAIKRRKHIKTMFIANILMIFSWQSHIIADFDFTGEERGYLWKIRRANPFFSQESINSFDNICFFIFLFIIGIVIWKKMTRNIYVEKTCQIIETNNRIARKKKELLEKFSERANHINRAVLFSTFPF